jgi:hypothetical protein
VVVVVVEVVTLDVAARSFFETECTKNVRSFNEGKNHKNGVDS